MKAAILVEQNKPLVVEEVEIPQRLEVGQVLVRVHYSGICGSQLGEIDGVKGSDKYLPHLLGHEGSGTVLDIGPGVSHVKPDDKVVLHWRTGLGIESPTPAYKWDGRKVNAGWVTTFNEFAIVSENRLTRIPADSDMEVAMLFGCTVTTGFGVVENDSRVRIGESIVVYGAGGIGLTIIQASALASAHPIIAVDVFDNRLELAKQMGATHTINSNKGNAEEAMSEIVGSSGIDVFIDNTGQPKNIELGYRITNPQGRVILVGVPRKGDSISIYSLPLHFGKALNGSHGGRAVPQADIPRINKLFRAGKLPLRQLLTKGYPLDQINEAISAMRSGALSGRCVIKMS